MKKALFCALFAAATVANAEIVVGVSVSATGPGTSLGVPTQNAIGIAPKTIAGQPVRYVVLDDTSDPTAGVRNIRRFVSDDRVDVIIGSSTVPVGIAQGGAANEAKVAIIVMCPVPIDPAKLPYVYAVPQPISLVTDAIAEHMRTTNVKSVGFIGFADAWGDLTSRSMAASGKQFGINLVSNERFARNDTSVSAQMLKVISGNPDAIFVGGAGTPSALPQIAAQERGFRKTLYHTHGVVNRDFIKVAGKSAEGAMAPTGPVMVAEQLPDNHPTKAAGLEFLKRYEGQYGAGSRNAFAAYAWDGIAVISAAAPAALQRAKPGTPEFRQAMRDAIEGVKDVRGTHAVYNMSASDHYGVDKRAVVMVRVENGEWKLVR
jgi:branched-chain amino acid transport system substrate-binding protein